MVDRPARIRADAVELAELLAEARRHVAQLAGEAFPRALESPRPDLRSRARGTERVLAERLEPRPLRPEVRRVEVRDADQAHVFPRGGLGEDAVEHALEVASDLVLASLVEDAEDPLADARGLAEVLDAELVVVLLGGRDEDDGIREVEEVLRDRPVPLVRRVDIGRVHEDDPARLLARVGAQEDAEAFALRRELLGPLERVLRVAGQEGPVRERRALGLVDVDGGSLREPRERGAARDVLGSEPVEDGRLPDVRASGDDDDGRGLLPSPRLEAQLHVEEALRARELPGSLGRGVGPGHERELGEVAGELVEVQGTPIVNPGSVSAGACVRG